MRLPALALLALAAPSAANTGKVVRVEKPQRARVYIPSGTFAMGLTEEEMLAVATECESAIETAQNVSLTGNEGLCGIYREELAHMEAREVYVDAFALDRTEVTTGDYRRCVAAGGCSLDALIAGDERYIGTDAYPMVNVTWDDARRFCSWRGGRLPSEAEWERAARSADGRTWPWGDATRPNEFNHGKPRAHVVQKVDHQNAGLVLSDPDASDGFELLAPVGSFPWGEGPYGTLDQAGNVAEWTADAWIHSEHEIGYQSLERDTWRSLPTVNPLRDGPTSEKRVVRGGSWREPTFVARANVRDPWNLIYDPNGRYAHIGFRCAYRP